MAEAFKEAQAVKPVVKGPERRTLPKIEREPHSAITVLARAASNIRSHSESTYRDVRSAQRGSEVTRNVQALLPEGSTTLSERCSRMLPS